MQTAATILLAAILAVAMGLFALMGLLRRRRTGALARQAHQGGMRFDAADPFDMPRRCAAFELIRSGHSPLARNVAHGRTAGATVRVFDFLHEQGHGTQRLARRYAAVVVELPAPLPEAFLWHAEDEPWPLPAASGGVRREAWIAVGEPSSVNRAVAACGEFAGRGLSVEVRGDRVLACAPDRAASGRSLTLDEAGRLAAAFVPQA